MEILQFVTFGKRSSTHEVLIIEGKHVFTLRRAYDLQAKFCLKNQMVQPNRVELVTVRCVNCESNSRTLITQTGNPGKTGKLRTERQLQET